MEKQASVVGSPPPELAAVAPASPENTAGDTAE